MPRLALFVIGSTLAHCVALSLLAFSSPRTDPRRVLVVSALVLEQPPPTVRAEPAPEAEAEMPPGPGRRAEARGSRRERLATAPRAVPPEAAAPRPAGEPEAGRPTLGAPSSEAPEPTSTPAATAPASRVTDVPAPATGGSGPAARRESPPRPDPCDELPRAVSGGLGRIAYPAWARDLRLRGLVRVNLRVGTDGTARGARVVASSGNTALDRHTIESVRRLHGLPRCARSVTVPVRYELPGD